MLGSGQVHISYVDRPGPPYLYTLEGLHQELTTDKKWIFAYLDIHLGRLFTNKRETADIFKSLLKIHQFLTIILDSKQHIHPSSSS